MADAGPEMPLHSRPCARPAEARETRRRRGWEDRPLFDAPGLVPGSGAATRPAQWPTAAQRRQKACRTAPRPASGTPDGLRQALRAGPEMPLTDAAPVSLPVCTACPTQGLLRITAELYADLLRV